MTLQDLIKIFIHLILSIFGVAARELRYKEIKHLELAKLVSSMIVSSFGAVIIYFISSMANIPEQMGYILAGLVGWGGPQILDKIFEKNINLTIDSNNNG